MQGVDEAFDESESAINAAEKSLKVFLKEARARCDAGSEMTFISLQKESHVLEIPQVSLLTMLLQDCECVTLDADERRSIADQCFGHQHCIEAVLQA